MNGRERILAMLDGKEVDHLPAISDPCREAADLGADVGFFDDQPPAIVDGAGTVRW